VLRKRKPVPEGSLNKVLQDLDTRKRLIRQQFQSPSPESSAGSSVRQQRMRQALALLFGTAEGAEGTTS